MSQPQTAIIPDHALSGVFIEADILEGRHEEIKAACRAALAALDKLKSRFPDDILGMTIAFGSEAWAAFGHSEEGREIKPFAPLGNEIGRAHV